MNDLMIYDQGKSIQMSYEPCARWNQNKLDKFWGMTIASKLEQNI